MKGHIKLVDFGLAKEGVQEATDGASSLCGTPEYLSPEVLDRRGHGTAVDWWNLGMVTYEMLTGLPPWYTTDRQKLFEAIRSAPLKFPMSVSRTAALFIQVFLILLVSPCNLPYLLSAHDLQSLLNRNPHARMGSRGASEVKTHPFLSSIDFIALYNKKITPPFDPCRNYSEIESKNFEREFTAMPVNSVDDSSSNNSVNSELSDTFLNFTYEEESRLESAREDWVASRRK